MGGITRRDLFKLSVGAASFAVYSGLGVRGCRKAYAVAGIDDAVLGGLVLLVATLGGYAVSRSVANVSLDALGYGFSDFVSDSNNQAAAVTQAIADANNLGVELNRSNAENAAQSIAAGTGYFAEVMGDAATSGRVALDNFISGAGELPGVLRTAVAQFVGSNLVKVDGLGFDYAKTVPGQATLSTGDTIPYSLGVASAADIAADFDSFGTAPNYANVAFWYSTNWADLPVGTLVGSYTFFDSVRVASTSASSISLYFNGNGMSYAIRTKYDDDVLVRYIYSSYAESNVTLNKAANRINFLSDAVVTGGLMPVVDRAADAPDVIGPGYDSLPLANDLVIDPNTDEVTSAGSLPLPTGIPDVFGDYVGTLNDILAGVVPGTIGLPLSISEPVVVGTAEGVQSMSISDAIAADTSLAATVTPPIPDYPPFDPVEPPTEVPEGPWTPAVTLPFEQIWPFNMIYSFVQLFDDLGGA